MINFEKLFSREALDKMRSPEKLDTLLHITNPIAWMGLAAMLLLLVGVVIWSFMGSFTVKADGIGLLTDTGGVRKITSLNSGRVDWVYVSKGSKIKKNQQLVDLKQVSMKADTQATKNVIEAGSSFSDVSSRVSTHDARKAAEAAAERIYSPYEGIVTEIFVDEGAMVNAGDEICTIRLDEGHKDLRGIMYVSVEQGKRIEPGMSIQLAPNGTDTSQNGSLLGVVRSVSQYPIDKSSLMWNLGNSLMANAVVSSLGNALVEVRFDLVKNKSDASGYLWTSTIGEHKPVTAGTYVSGSVIVERVAPIEKVFNKMSQWLRSR